MNRHEKRAEAWYTHPDYGLLRVVAVANLDVGDWAAYQHLASHSQDEVANNGDKISQERADALFPEFASTYFWRD